MIPFGAHVLLSTPGVGVTAGPTVRGIVRGLAPWATADCWPGSDIYQLEIDGVIYFAIGELLTVIDRPAAAYSIESGRA